MSGSESGVPNIGREKPTFFSFTINSIGALVAILISISSLVYTYLSGRLAGEHEAVKSVYNTYFDASKTQLNVPEAMHVFVLSNAYKEVACDVKRAVLDAVPQDKARYRLKERAMADYLFTIYEFMILDYNASQSFFGDDRRAEEDKKAILYFTDDLLRNPRLLWYWDASGGKLESEYREETKKHYMEHVRNNPGRPSPVDEDEIGPLADDPDPDHKNAALQRYCGP
jgi:hypothetical protein